MKKIFDSVVVRTGLSIFAMLFGAGNLIFPAQTGVLAGNATAIGLLGFLISAVILPLTGSFGMVFFDGEYHTFFERIGKIPGQAIVFFCMLIIGPLLVMPRIISYSHVLLEPFIGQYIPLFPFSILFATLTFLCSYRKNKLIDLIGNWLSPIILISLAVIMVAGFLTRGTPINFLGDTFALFKHNFLQGYKTLDLLGTIFFSVMTLSILKKTLPKEIQRDHKKVGSIVLKASLIAGLLLGIVYCGMGFLGAFHGHGLEGLSEGAIFRELVIRVLGHWGAFFVSCTVFFACLTTIIGLAAVVSGYLKEDIFKNRVGYLTCLIIVLIISALLAQLTLDKILFYTAPLIFIMYPVIICITFCNIAYKLWGFTPVKTPALVTLLISTYLHGPELYDRYLIATNEQHHLALDSLEKEDVIPEARANQEQQ